MLEVFFLKCPWCKKCPIQFQWAFAVARQTSKWFCNSRERVSTNPITEPFQRVKTFKNVAWLKMCNCVIGLVRKVGNNTHKINGCLGQNLMGKHLGKSAFYSPTKDYRVYSFLKREFPTKTTIKHE